MGDPSGGVPHLPGSLNLSKRDFEELLAIVAKSKEDELRNGLSASQQRRSTVKRKGKSRSEQAGKDQAQALNSINWLVDQEEEPEIDQGWEFDTNGPNFPRSTPQLTFWFDF